MFSDVPLHQQRPVDKTHNAYLLSDTSYAFAYASQVPVWIDKKLACLNYKTCIEIYDLHEQPECDYQE